MGYCFHLTFYCLNSLAEVKDYHHHEEHVKTGEISVRDNAL